jgi:polyphosphate kinase
MNSLEDPEMVKELYRASMAGVDIDLLVRGICRLRPGLEGVSDTVDVSSVVGRFLEHSRIFYFANGGASEPSRAATDGDAGTDDGGDGTAGTAGTASPASDDGGEYYIGSADWMTRNLDRRVEAVTPVEDPDLRAELQYVLDAMREDNRKRWVMASDGSYEQVRPGDEPVRNTHQRLMHRAKASVPEEETTVAFSERAARDSAVDLGGVFTDDR